MKIAFLFATVVVSGMSLPLVAQEAKASDSRSSFPAEQHQPPAKISPLAYDYMRPVTFELAGKLDSKSAKAGDVVVARATANVPLADGTLIPKGAKLMGHLSNVQAHSSADTVSHLSIVFDRIESSGGHSVPILSVIQAVTAPQSVYASAQNDDRDPFGSTGGTGTHGAAGARGAGGNFGGTGSVGTTAGNLGSTVGGSTSSGLAVPRTAGQTIDSLPGSAGPVRNNGGPVSGIGVNAATSASMGVHPTGVPGLMLAGDPSGTTAGTLSASNRNVHLDSGTQLIVAVAAISQ